MQELKAMMTQMMLESKKKPKSTHKPTAPKPKLVKALPDPFGYRIKTHSGSQDFVAMLRKKMVLNI